MMNYPNKKKIPEKPKNYANLGQTLERDIEITNEFYRLEGIAVIHKKPTPIQVVEVNYPARNKAKIVEAYYKIPSTTDFNGVYKGKYIDFDAKETNTKTSMPLSNIHPHQVLHLKNVDKSGGIAFLIVHFKQYAEYFVLPSNVLFRCWDDSQNGGRKSIPYQVFKNEAFQIRFGLNPRLDYLRVLEDNLM